MHDRKHENRFVWQSDDTPLTYSNWRSGEPNNNWGGTDEDCAMISGTKRSNHNWRIVIVEKEFKWNDVPCHMKHDGRAICQKQ